MKKIILSFLLVFIFPIFVFALDDVSEVSWKDNELLTATWSEVENANNYEITRYITNNEGVLDTSVLNITTNEIDLLNSVNTYLLDKNIDSVNVSFKVKAQHIEEDNTESAEYSNVSILKEYNVPKLQVPQNPSWDQNYTAVAKWDSVSGAESYIVSFNIYLDNEYYTSSSFGFDYNEVDLYQSILDLIPQNNTKQIKVDYKVKAYKTPSIDNLVRPSDYSALSSKITIEDLAIPQNLTWKDGSRATAKWNAVANANYYKVTVEVFDESESIGEFETGTSDTELDLQQEINNIIGQRQVTTVKIRFKVASVLDLYNGQFIESKYSTFSIFKDYFVNITKERIQLETPVITYDSETLTARWNNVEHYNNWKLIIYMNDGENEYSSSYIVGCNPVSGCSLGWAFKELYNKYNLAPKEVQVSFKIRSDGWEDETHIYLASPYSELVNGITYSRPVIKKEEIQLETPVITYDSETLTARWNNVEHYNNWKLIIYMNDGENEYSSSHIVGCNPVSGCSLGWAFKELYNKYNLAPKEVQVSFKIRSDGWEDEYYTYLASPYSELVTGITYSRPIIVKEEIQLETPAITYDSETLTARWNNVEHYNNWNVNIYFTDGASEYKKNYIIGCNPVSGLSLNYHLNEIYNNYNMSPSPIMYSIEVKSDGWEDETHKYLASDYSNRTEWALYNPNNSKLVETISLSPKTPYVAVGRRLAIGKTITPIDAVYRSIAWSSDNEEIVSIDSMGFITGNKVGNASITGKIFNVSDTANVVVYEIDTNLLKAQSEKIVIDNASNIINAVANNQDTTNTDILNEDLELITTQIREAMDNQEQFGVNVNPKVVAKTEAEEGISEAKQLLSSYKYDSVYDVKLNVSHYENNNKESLFNIEKLEGTVDFDLKVKSTSSIKKGYKRLYKVVREHDGEYSVLKTGDLNSKKQITTTTDKFSRFILMYKDIKPEYLASSRITLSKTKYTYDGNAKKPKVTVKNKSKKTLKEGTDYKISYKNNKEAGTASVKITGLGKYSGTIKKTFRINKAKNPISISYIKNYSVKYSKTKSYKQKMIWINNKQGKLSYRKTSGSSLITVDSKTGQVTIKKGIKKGKYTIKVKVTAKGNSNYNSGSKTATIKIKVE